MHHGPCVPNAENQPETQSKIPSLNSSNSTLSVTPAFLPNLCPECHLPVAETVKDESLVTIEYFYCANGHCWNLVHVED